MTGENKTRLYRIISSWYNSGWEAFLEGTQGKHFKQMCDELGIVYAKFGEHIPGYVEIPYPAEAFSLNYKLFLPSDLALKILTLGYIPNP